jgi:hypothetical protein
MVGDVDGAMMGSVFFASAARPMPHPKRRLGWAGESEVDAGPDDEDKARAEEELEAEDKIDAGALSPAGTETAAGRSDRFEKDASCEELRGLEAAAALIPREDESEDDNDEAIDDARFCDDVSRDDDVGTPSFAVSSACGATSEKDDLRVVEEDRGTEADDDKVVPSEVIEVGIDVIEEYIDVISEDMADGVVGVVGVVGVEAEREV